jgi:predicted TIM-barrel fold metal-dependent hydrolase
MDDAVKEVERCVRELGLIGIKLHPWLQAFSMTHPGVDLIFDAAAALKVPVLLHDGSPPYSTPRQIAWVARKHPDVQVIFGHSGLADLWRDAADAARVCPNIWLQPSAAPPVTIRTGLEAVGPDRILFGSDGGFGTVRFMRYTIAKSRSALGDAVFDRVTTVNPNRVLERARGG